MKQKRLLLIPLLLAASCGKKEAAETEAPAPVQVTAVTQDTIRRIVAGDGVLFPRDQASVMPKIAAPVQKFLIQRGDHVREGQLLAVLESRDLAAAEGESKAALAQAEANLHSTSAAQVPEAIVKAKTDVDAFTQTDGAAKKLLDNRERLFKQGALARKLVDDAEVSYAQSRAALLSAREHLRALESVSKDAQIKTATSQVDAARSHLESSQAQMSYARVLSPISGVVSDRPLYAGEMATPGAPLVTVMDISKVVARANIPQSQSAGVKVGQSASITQVDTNETVEGKVIVVSPATDPSSTTLQVWVEAGNPGERLKPGTSVHVAIMTEVIKATPVVPVAAILPGEEGGTACLVITADRVAHRRSVKLGVREGDKVQILNGVRPGEEVVIVGGIGLDDKAKVKVIDPAVKEAPEEDEDTADEKKGGADAKGDAKPKSK
jgi:HlyD family secretion protein